MPGFRTWTDEDDLLAYDINTFLMGQVVPRFATATERDAQMGVPVQGQLSYVLDVGLAMANAAGVWVLLAGPGAASVVAEGVNARMGAATLVGGTVVVATTAVKATSRIMMTVQSLGTVTLPSALAVSARTALTSFTILASQPTDTSVVAWRITDPA